jgi:F0F1-type ATP synthase membrane subunit b/b'
VKSVVGAILSFLILLLVAFGIISFATEYFLGKPLLKVIEDFLFMFYRK